MSEIHEPLRVARLTVAAACAALCAVACGSHESDNKPGGNASTPAKSVASAPIDACAMVSADDITALLGTPVPGQSTATRPDMGGCKWENGDTYESVSLEIGNPGTAPNNTLPPVDPAFSFTPGPDGMRYMGGGQVGFAAGNRSNTVQVAVLKLAGDNANAAAVDLARKVAPRVPA